jgi:hypothetical protein
MTTVFEIGGKNAATSPIGCRGTLHHVMIRGIEKRRIVKDQIIDKLISKLCESAKVSIKELKSGNRRKEVSGVRYLDSWWKSFEKTLLPDILSFTETEAKPKNSELIGPRVFHDRPDDRAHCIAVYEANVAAVKKHVPAERLLVHRLGDGWRPLCAHLGVPVPDIPYPNKNSSSAFQNEFLITPNT